MGLPVSTVSSDAKYTQTVTSQFHTTYESIDTFSTKISHLRQGCLCKELPRPPARGLHCRKAPALVFARCPQTLASPDRQSLSHKASSALPALVPGPLLARPAHGFGSVCSLRIKLCWPGGSMPPRACGLWHLSQLWMEPEPLGAARGWTSHGAATAGTTRSCFTGRAVAPQAPRSKGVMIQQRSEWR